jgi:hypothetical protein
MSRSVDAGGGAVDNLAMNRTSRGGSMRFIIIPVVAFIMLVSTAGAADAARHHHHHHHHHAHVHQVHSSPSPHRVTANPAGAGSSSAASEVPFVDGEEVNPTELVEAEKEYEEQTGEPMEPAPTEPSIEVEEDEE